MPRISPISLVPPRPRDFDLAALKLAGGEARNTQRAPVVECQRVDVFHEAGVYASVGTAYTWPVAACA